jgi:CHASE3 domain sensor protein
MKHPYLETYTLLFGAILFGLVTLGVLSYKTSNTHKETSKLVINSHQVLFQAEHLLSAIKDLQINRRGYHLTHDSIFVSSFLNSRAAFIKYADSLDFLTKNNAGQQVRVNALKTLITNRSQLSLQIIDLTKNVVQNRELIQKATEKGNTLIKSMENVIQEIQNEENRLLVIRDNFYHENVNAQNQRFFIFLFIAAFFVVGVYFIMSNDLKYRKETEKRIGRLNEKLGLRVQEKSREVIEKEKRYHWVLDNMLEGIQIIDFNWKYLYVNEAWAKQAKCSVDELSGQRLIDKYPGMEASGLFQVLNECMNSRTSKRLENEFTYPNGDKGFYDLSIQPVPEGILILSMDISERRKRELEKEQYIKELKEVLFKISHEVRHPVVQILGVSDLLEQQLISPDEFGIFMSAMRESAQLLDSHTRDLTNFVYSMKNNSQTGTMVN